MLRLSATNPSQPPLTIGQVRIYAGGEALAADLLTVSLPDPALPADGQPRSIGVLFPADRLAEALEAEVCEEGAEPRCVRLAVR